MRCVGVLFIFLLIGVSLGVETDELPRKNNMVSKYLNKILSQFFEEVSGKTLTIPELNFGDDVGQLSNMEGRIVGELTKLVDGYKSFGCKLNTNATKISLTGQYNFLNLDFPGLFPIFGKGNFQIDVEQINFNMLLDPIYDLNSEKFDINLPIFKILVENSTVRFENLMNDAHLAHFLNELISNLIPDLATMLTDPLLEIVKPLINHFGNGIINCIKTQPLAIDECVRKLFQPDPVYAFLSRLGVDLQTKISLSDVSNIL